MSAPSIRTPALPAFHVLAKPTGATCNLDCTYCFFLSKELLYPGSRFRGVALLPDYLVEENGGLVQLFGESDTIALDAYFVYPEELKSVARVQVFRDFLVAKAQRWHF